MRTIVLVLFAAVLAPSITWAQPLADRVPEDAILYAGWQGSRSMPPAYQQSRLKALVDSSNFPALFGQFVPRLVERIIRDRRDAAELRPRIQAILSMGGYLWRHPTAIYLRAPDPAAGEVGDPQGALLCLAGQEADAALAAFQKVVQLAKDSPVPLNAYKEGGLVILAAGEAQPPAPNAGRALAASARFQAILKRVDPSAVAVMYADVATLVRLAGAAGDQVDRNWQEVKEALGLAGFRQAIVTGGFDGRDWSTRIFLELTPQRSGMPVSLAGAPLSKELYRAIPATTTWAGATHVDHAELIDQIRAILTSESPATLEAIDKAIADANRRWGADLRKDLLGALGSEWAYFIDPQHVGNGILSVAVVNQLRQPDSAELALGRLEQVANALVAEQLQDTPVRIAVEPGRVGDQTVHRLSLPLFAPSWTIRDGRLYAGLQTQVALAAAVDAQAPRKSILDNPDFQALYRRIGNEKANSFSFVDVPRTAPSAYGGLLFIAQLGLGAADLMGVQSPPMVLPPYRDIRPHLSPAAAFTWADEAGWHYRAVGPFPGAGFVAGESNMTVASSALMVSILLPALNAAKERANRVKCASNLRQIGQGVLLYANDHNGAYPKMLGELIREVDLHPEVMICPSGSNELPDDLAGADVDRQVAWANLNADYVYLGAKLNSNSPADSVLAYEKPANHDQEGINILFNDGHVEWVVMDRARQMLQLKE